MVVALQAYYDGSGSPAFGVRGEVITLAGYAAAPSVWAEFESEWWNVLADSGVRPACCCLHMADASALQGEFSSDRGWTEQGVHFLVRDLFNRCFSPRGMHKPIADALVGAACSVDLAAYEQVCLEYPHFAEKRPEALCVDHVTSVAIQQLVGELEQILWEDLLAQDRKIDVFFDRNERYRHHIQRVWEGRGGRRPTKPLKLINSISTKNGRQSAALQAADFLAWHVNRYVCSVTDAMDAKMMASLASRCSIVEYDYEELKATAARWRSIDGYNAVEQPV